MDSRLNPFQDKMEKTLNNLEEEYAGIRAGRANPHILDKLRVDYYGTPSPIQSVANVSVPEPRMIQIQPWEASMVKEIEKVILYHWNRDYPADTYFDLDLTDWKITRTEEFPGFSHDKITEEVYCR